MVMVQVGVAQQRISVDRDISLNSAFAPCWSEPVLVVPGGEEQGQGVEKGGNGSGTGGMSLGWLMVVVVVVVVVEGGGRGPLCQQ